jgi:hypothetical protein
LQDWLFVGEDVEEMEVNGATTPVAPSAMKAARPEHPIDSRERTSLLRIIRALEVMAKLKARGAATPIVRQLQELGFDGPNEAMIRQTLERARGLEPEKKPQ